MKVWWTAAPKPGNFGDILTPRIFEHFRIPCEFSDDFEAISTGSIARVAKPGTIVLGSGIIGSSQSLCPDADWRFVRGPYTRANVIKAGGTCPEIYGDPALLLPLMCHESEKEYDVGIVPHYVDYHWVKEQHPYCHVINLLNSDPFEVAREITKCRAIISSSLHGIICAHAYHIPAAWVQFSDKVKGDGVKFKDYYAAVGLGDVTEPSEFANPRFTVGTFNIAPIVDIFKSLR